MIQLAQKLLSKPKDSTIRISRLIVALLFILIIVGGWDTFQMQIAYTDITLPVWTKYFLFLCAGLSILRGTLDPGLFRRKAWKWITVGRGVLMMLVAFFLIDEIDTTPQMIAPVVQTGSGISLSDLSNQPTVSSSGWTTFFDTDSWIMFAGILTIIFGLTLNSKNITKKNERYGEKVTKIRV